MYNLNWQTFLWFHPRITSSRTGDTFLSRSLTLKGDGGGRVGETDGEVERGNGEWSEEEVSSTSVKGEGDRDDWMDDVSGFWDSSPKYFS